MENVPVLVPPPVAVNAVPSAGLCHIIGKTESSKPVYVHHPKNKPLSLHYQLSSVALHLSLVAPKLSAYVRPFDIQAIKPFQIASEDHAPRSAAQHRRFAMSTEILHNGRNIAYDPATVATTSPADDTTPTSSTRRTNLEPVTIQWRNLTFDVPNKAAAKRAAKQAKAAKQADDNKERSTDVDADPVVPFIPMNLLPGADPAAPAASVSRVLHGVSGVVRPGQMLAILGASGAGKSTVLNLLAGRIKSSKACLSGGSILVNGKKRDFKLFKKQAAFVEQDDCMFVEETVREHITYSAMLRLPSSVSRERKKLRVESVIAELGLSVCADTRISRISGGQRKRVSIGSELVTDPSLCILDEPTSGLDAFSSLTVMQSLRHLASNGRTVISTIHQPRSSIFALFDLLLVLSEGRTVYFGRAADAAAYFAGIGFRAPPQFNVADYVIDAVSIDYRSKELESTTKKRVLYFAAEHDAKHGSGDVGNVEAVNDDSVLAPAVDIDGSDSNSNSDGKAVRYKDRYQNNFVAEWLILTLRAYRRLGRDKQQNVTRLAQTVIFAVLLAFIWLNVGRKNTGPVGYFSVVGVIFFIVVNQGFDAAFGIIFGFPLERAVLMRERATGAYRTITYFFSTVMIGCTKTVVLNCLFLSIVYWAVGLRESASAFLFALLVVFITGQAGESIAQTVSVFAGDPQISAAIVPLVVILCFLTAGFFIPPSAMPGALRWLRYCSFLYWGYEALIKNEFGPIANDVDAANILKGFNDHSRWINLLALVAVALISKASFFGALLWRSPKFDKTL
jgi:ABC-type multidrug transport system ATPase subunit